VLHTVRCLLFVALFLLPLFVLVRYTAFAAFTVVAWFALFTLICVVIVVYPVVHTLR